MLTEQLSDFLYEVRYDSLSSKAVDNARLYLGDLPSVAAVGLVQPQGGIWRSYFTAGDGQQGVTAWNSGPERFSCKHAAALNAACAHVMDMDDVHNASITRLGAVTIPAVLVVGQKLHRSGCEVLAAIAVGYKIGARVGGAINPGSHYYWHTTGMVGALCSAVVAGKLMRLDRKKLLHTIGSVGMQVAGLQQSLKDGAMSKTLHTANGTLCGLRLVRLAVLGFTAAEDILAGGRGLLNTMTPDNHPEALARALSWENCALLANSLKPYACCHHTHAVDYCAQLLRGEHRLEPRYITHIVDHIYQVTVNTVDNPEPSAPYGCRFSGQYRTAAMLAYGHLGEPTFTPEAISDPRVRRLMGKITPVCDPELEASYQADRNRWAHRLEVTLEDGRVLIRQVEYPYGDSNNPFTQAYEHKKFYILADGALGLDRVTALVEWSPHLEELGDINRLFEGL